MDISNRSKGAVVSFSFFFPLLFYDFESVHQFIFIGLAKDTRHNPVHVESKVH